MSLQTLLQKIKSNQNKLTQSSGLNITSSINDLNLPIHAVSKIDLEIFCHSTIIHYNCPHIQYREWAGAIAVWKNGDRIVSPYICFHRPLDKACGAVVPQTEIFNWSGKHQLHNWCFLIKTDSRIQKLLVIPSLVHRIYLLRTKICSTLDLFDLM